MAKLMIEDLHRGTGARAIPGKTVSVHYTGWLQDGQKFDSSVDRGEPFSFALGRSQVIKGWDRGVQGMHVGGKRRLTIPPELGYGRRGFGSLIPPNATLVFEGRAARGVVGQTRSERSRFPCRMQRTNDASEPEGPCRQPHSLGPQMGQSPLGRSPS